MRFYGALFTAAVAFSALTAASPGIQDRACGSNVSCRRNTGSWRRVRDAVIQKIWKVPDHHRSSSPSIDSALPSPKLPSNLLARYGDQMVLRFQITTASEAAALLEVTDTLLLDVWEFTHDWVDIRLAEDVVPLLLGLLPESLQHAHRPLIPNLARAIFETYPSAMFQQEPIASSDGFGTSAPSPRIPPDTSNIFFRDYQPWSVIVPWMRLLSSMFTTHVRLISVGTSSEGREMFALRVGVHPTNAEQPSERRRTIIISGGAHAREWISTSTVNYVAYSMITAYGKSQALTRLMEEFDFVFIPSLNPDGYVYSWEEDRLWRKNRQQTSLPFCRGVDLDRSWGFAWDGDASQNNPCYESYAGSEPFSAVETRHFSEWARNETENNNAWIVGFLDLHSYSEQIYYPFSYSCMSTPPDIENLEELALGLAKAIRTTSGELYSVSAACEGNFAIHNDGKKEYFPRMETGGGSALDWFYHELKTHYSYQIKLRDTGAYGFLLPKEDIVPTGKEVYSAVVQFAKFYLSRHVETKDQRPKTSEILESEEIEALTPKKQPQQQQQQQQQPAIEPFNTPQLINWELRRRRRK